MGVKKTMVVVDAPESRRRGTEAERKRISSVTGPWVSEGEVRF
jgi:hypothetical protein